MPGGGGPLKGGPCPGKGGLYPGYPGGGAIIPIPGAPTPLPGPAKPAGACWPNGVIYTALPIGYAFPGPPIAAPSPILLAG